MDDLEKALRIALDAHAGQKQKNGEPYILHPLRVMMHMATMKGKVAALLHDVLEDSDWTEERLRAEGFSVDVLLAVRLLTHLPEQSYEAYIHGLEDNPLARKIKLADLTDNMNIQRLSTLREKDLKRLEKYHKYWLRLVRIEEGEPDS
ncbi:MAG: HD domain-containing protein [Calditrichaeota bacterium]|nr:MAG: HD domain-containing protein [Calditrichota bacterium]